MKEDTQGSTKSQSDDEDGENQEMDTGDGEEISEVEIKKEACKKYLGYGHTGVIPLPTRYDDYEHRSLNFRGPGGKGEIKEVGFLVFGGISFKGDESKETFHLQVDMVNKNFILTNLPKARLDQADRFLDNSTMHIDADTNVVTIVGKHAL